MSLDVDMVSAICPLCHILLVESNTNYPDSMGPAATYAATQAHYVSNSYGGHEFLGETSYAGYYSHPGTIFTASTGDDSYSFGVQQPSAFGSVVAVGGTSLQTAATTRGWTETAWGNEVPNEGAGSGCSVYVAKPSWQNSAVTGCSTRAVADISAVADPATGVTVYDTYGYSGFLVLGGTSAASPIVASAYALKGQGFAMQDASALWSFAPKGFYDVKKGNNGTCSPSQLCTARAGWDGPTGWGTPNGLGALGVYGPTADLKIQETKLAHTPSGQVTLGFTITNLGPSTVSGLKLVDDLVAPSFVSFGWGSANPWTCGLTTPPAGKTHELTCSGSFSLASGGVGYLTVEYNGGSKGSFDSTASISGSPVDVKPANNTVHITTAFPK
jgi:hypothetical protein